MHRKTLLAAVSAFLIVLLTAGCSLFDKTSVDEDITVPDVENVALGKSTEVSSAITSGAAAVDGNLSSRWISGDGAPAPHWLVVDLGGSYDVYSIVARTGFITGSQDIKFPVPEFTLQYWDGETWVDFPGGTVADNTDTDKEFFFATPINTTKVRFYTEHPGTLADGFVVHRVRELEVYGVPAA